ncbi:uncharacterized protein LOC111344337 isoform X2 [Stylophora pistillata]|uniref:uncharacterized protein LOC111344337 isoform X2 n=1 Tax=Stylophora pistillata TaxID=50429 RepID=UPI000C05535E|nr:uncharacterized protein LOC111344337 isoform X2 [Stylophora pistillata]
MILLFVVCFLVELQTAAIQIDANQSATILVGDRRNSTRCVSVAHVNTTEGRVVKLQWSFSKASLGQELRVLRLEINSVYIAFMPKKSLEMTCIKSTFIKDIIWKEFCPKRMKFKSNQTHLSVEIRNLPRGSSGWTFNLNYQFQTYDFTCPYQDIIILTVLPFASTNMSIQETIQKKYSTTVGVVPSLVVLSTVSASAHKTVTPPISGTPTFISPKISPGFHKTVGPSNTVVPSTVYIASANDQNTVEPPTTVDTLSPDVQGISDNPPIRDNGVSAAFIVVPMLLLVALRFIITGLSRQERIARYLNSLVS